MALATNLVAYWSLEEASGTRVDATGRGNDLTPQNTPGNATGKISNAVQLVRASSQRLTKTDNTDLNMGDIDFSITAWVYLDTKPAAGVIAGRWSDVALKDEYWLGYLGGGTDRFVGFISANGSASVQVTANNFGAVSTATWYFLCETYEAATDTFSLSVNAGTPNTASHAGGTFDSNTEFCIGAQRPETSPVNHWDGRIDEVGVWKRLLSSAEITQLYNSGSGMSYASIAADGAGQPTGRSHRLLSMAGVG